MLAAVLSSRTSDRSEAGGLGAQALGARLGAATLGTPGPPRDGRWEDDLRDAAEALEVAGAFVGGALAAGEKPLLLAGDCTICVATLPALAAHSPRARVLWLDAHPDLHTPATTPSGFLGGMCLGAAVGRWESGFGTGPALERVTFVDGRDADPEERDALAAAGRALPGDLSELDGAKVLLHVDLDVLDPGVLPATFPAPGGLDAVQLHALLADVAARCEVVGMEVTSANATVGATLHEALEPALRALV